MKNATPPSAPRPRGWRPWALVAGALAGAAFGAVGLARGREEVRRDPGLSVLLVTIDTLRADALGCYGQRAATTPWVDRLAGSGVRFEEARAQNVITLPSHANILSGRLPLERYTDEDDPKRLIALDRQLQDVVTRHTQGDLPAALALCEDLVRRRPDMALSLLHLGFLRRQGGDLRGAVEA